MNYTTIEDERLLTCPFCGEDGVVAYYPAEKRMRAAYYVGCSNDNCGCEIERAGGFESFNDALNAWNRQATRQQTAVWCYHDQNDITQHKWWYVQTCSKCGSGGDNFGRFRFCPSCGRKMTNAK